MKWFGYELEHNYWEMKKNLNSKLSKEHWNIKVVLMNNYAVMVLDMRISVLSHPKGRGLTCHIID